MPLVLTVTLNPALDATAHTSRVVPDRKTRVSDPRHDPGGGGINVARAVQSLGGPSRAVWTRGGPVGERLAARLDEEGVDHVPIDIEAETRENLTVTAEDGAQYRFTRPGAEVSGEALARVCEEVSELDGEDLVVLSGSLPPGLDEQAWARIIEHVPPEVTIVVDTSGEALAHAVEAGVDWAKPNLHELSALGEVPDDEAGLARAARRIVERRGLPHLLVSLGAAGALWATEEDVWRLYGPWVAPHSQVGAGDSAVAGLVLGLLEGREPREAACRAVAAGAAATLTPGTELCRREDAQRLLELVHGVQLEDV